MLDKYIYYSHKCQTPIQGSRATERVPNQNDLISGGVDTAAVGGTFDISNLDRLGFSEVCKS